MSKLYFELFYDRGNDTVKLEADGEYEYHVAHVGDTNFYDYCGEDVNDMDGFKQLPPGWIIEAFDAFTLDFEYERPEEYEKYCVEDRKREEGKQWELLCGFEQPDGLYDDVIYGF